MKVFRALARPTLLRRVCLALLGAFLLCWIVLMVIIQIVNREDDKREHAMQAFFSYMLSDLKEAESENAAGYYLAGLVNGTNRFICKNCRPMIWVQMRDARGKLVFTNFAPEEAPEIEASLRLPVDAKNDKYFIAHGSTVLWTLAAASERYTITEIFLDTWGKLSMYLLAAFPVVLLPIWFAVSRGLRPLQQLSDRLAARHAGDLTALNFHPQYEELKPLASTLDELLLALRNKIEREQAFVSDAAHEMRTPMAVMLAQTHVLAMADSPSLRREAEQRMEQAIDRSSHLIAQLLQLAHVDHDRATAGEPLDVAQLVREELALAAPAAMARQMELSLDAPDTLWHTLDRNAIQSILHNLVENAIRYVQPGGKIDVQLFERTHESDKENNQDKALILTVCDNGPGIPESDRALVFERFHRGVGHDVAGSGLGLAIVKRALEKLGGQVVLGNGPDGRGCQFVVTIPAR
jgi:two-component system sensor histidine kinase QseC